MFKNHSHFGFLMRIELISPMGDFNRTFEMEVFKGYHGSFTFKFYYELDFNDLDASIQRHGLWYMYLTMIYLDDRSGQEKEELVVIYELYVQPSNLGAHQNDDASIVENSIKYWHHDSVCTNSNKQAHHKIASHCRSSHKYKWSSKYFSHDYYFTNRKLKKKLD